MLQSYATIKKTILERTFILHNMKIGELQAGMKNVSVVGKVESMGEERTVNLKSGGTNSVADAVLADQSGKIKLSLWGDDAKKYRAGDQLSIENAYISTYKGENSLATGKFGRIKRV